MVIYIYIYIPFHKVIGYITLVVGLEHSSFFHILGIRIPIDEYIVFGDVETTNQPQSEWPKLAVFVRAGFSSAPPKPAAAAPAPVAHPTGG